MTRFYERLMDDGLLNCDPWDIGVPDHDEDTHAVVVLPRDVAEHLPALLRHAAWSLSESYEFPEVFDPGGLPPRVTDALLGWLEAQS